MSDSNPQFEQGPQDALHDALINAVEPVFPDQPLYTIGSEIDGLAPESVQSAGRAQKFGRFITHLPGMTYRSLQRAAIALHNDPIGVSKRAVEGAVITTEIAPFLGGTLRYGGFAAILAATKNPALSVAYLSGSTFALESAATVAMSNVLERDQNRGIRFANKLADKLIRPEKRVSLLAEAVITNYLGVPVLLAVKQRENPDRNREQNIRHGLVATTALTGAIALQGLAISEGLLDPTNPRVVAPGVTFILGTAFLGNRFKKILNRKEQNTEITEIEANDDNS